MNNRAARPIGLGTAIIIIIGLIWFINYYQQERKVAPKSTLYYHPKVIRADGKGKIWESTNSLMFMSGLEWGFRVTPEPNDYFTLVAKARVEVIRKEPVERVVGKERTSHAVKAKTRIETAVFITPLEGENQGKGGWVWAEELKE